MNFLIREAKKEDAPAITNLSNQLGYNIAETATLYNLSVILQNTGEVVFVALHENKTIGWIHIFKTIRVESGPFCEIGGLVVDALYLRKGVGKKLVEQAKLWSHKHSDHSLRVRCNLRRKEAHQFYCQLGFKETKEQKVFEINL